MSAITVIDSIWFTEMGGSRPIGIVLINNGYEEKAYIGTGEGINQKDDEEMVAARGAHFPVELAKAILRNPCQDY